MNIIANQPAFHGSCHLGPTSFDSNARMKRMKEPLTAEIGHTTEIVSAIFFETKVMREPMKLLAPRR